MINLCFTAPVKIQSESNLREHWLKAAKRRTMQRDIIKIFWRKHCPSTIPLPVTITLTRIAPRSLDAHDNLPIAMKKVIDTIADILIPGLAKGRADSDPRISWIIKQKKGAPKEYALEIHLTTTESLPAHQADPST